MATETGRRPELTLGRKQDHNRTEAILATTRALLLDKGYDSFTIQDVAGEAGAGVGAIYRRWPNKESLAAEAIRTGGELSYETSDDPEADLTNLIQDRGALATTHPDFVPGVVSAMRTSVEINEAMQQVHTTTAYREILARYLGADHPHLLLLAELAPAIIVHRTIFGKDLDPESFSKDVLALVQAISNIPTIQHPSPTT
jgi:AcrR family transcriptional regulator